MWRAIVERWLRWQAARAGRKDGRRGIPAPDDPNLPFPVREILARAEDALWRAARAWEAEDGALRTRVAALRAEVADAETRLTELRERLAMARRERSSEDEGDRRALERLSERRARLDAGETAATPASASLGTPTAEQAEGPAGDASMPPSIEAPSPPAALVDPPFAAGRMGIPAWVYWLALVVIVAGEFPLNAVAFRLFGEPDLWTAVMTVGLATVLVGVAHVGGILLAREDGTPRERILLLAAVALPIAAILAVALIRAVYLEEVAAHHGLGRWLDAGAFAAINATIFGGAVLLSYLRHDPRSKQNLRAALRIRERERARAEERERQRLARLREAEADRRERERRERERARQEERARLDREMERIEGRSRARREELARLEAEAAELAGRIRSLQERRKSLRGERVRRWREHVALASRLRSAFEARIHAYCAANVRAREDRRAPVSLADLPPIPLPDAFLGPGPTGAEEAA